jgi:REP element-mobilizing transposase RayT
LFLRAGALDESGWLRAFVEMKYGFWRRGRLKACVIIAWGEAPGLKRKDIGELKARVILSSVPQSLSYVLVHLVFSTKDRRPLLKDGIRGEMHAYLASVLNGSENICVRVGGVADHVHIALFLARTESISRVVERLKVSSSKWIKQKGPEFARFGWQRGYAVFSVGLSDRPALVRYIDAQDTHHKKRDFKAEMRAMFSKYDVAFDERFVWD